MQIFVAMLHFVLDLTANKLYLYGTSLSRWFELKKSNDRNIYIFIIMLNTGRKRALEVLDIHKSFPLKEF